MRNYANLIPALSLALFLLSACGGEKTDKSGKPVDTPTTGNLSIMVDEAYQPIISTSLDVFHSMYAGRAHIDARYVSEGEAINSLMNDSVTVIIITRQLKEDEMAYFKSRGFTPPQTPIAYDALAFIVHPDNPDTVFTVEQIRKIITGEITSWKQINPKTTLGDIQLVFDHPMSGNVRYAKDSIAMGAPLAPKASALQSNEETINYVAQNRNAIGIIGANWISDTDDKGVQQFLKAIRIADIAREAGMTGYGPYQAFLATGDYPFKRGVYIINAQARQGLGSGLASFLASDQGQRIVLKDGLLPASAPMRLIKTSRN